MNTLCFKSIYTNCDNPVGPSMSTICDCLSSPDSYISNKAHTVLYDLRNFWAGGKRTNTSNLFFFYIKIRLRAVSCGKFLACNTISELTSHTH